MPLMIHIKRTWILAIVLSLLAILLDFNRELLHLDTHIPGAPTQAASALWHLWWPTYAANAPDGLAIHAFYGGPHLANHLRAVPLLQSVLYNLLAALTGNPVLALNLALITSTIATMLLTSVFLQQHNVPGALALLGGFALVVSAWYTSALMSSDLISASLWLLPLALFAWDLWQKRPSMVRALLIVLVLYASVLAGVQNLAWIACLWLPYAIWSWRTLRPGPASSAEKDGLLLVAVLFMILCFIFPGPNLVRTLQGNEPAYADAAWAGIPHSLGGTLLRASPVGVGIAIASLFFTQPRGEMRFWLAMGALLFVIGAGGFADPLLIPAGALNVAYQPLYTYTAFLGYSIFALITFASIAWSQAWERLAGAIRHGAAVIGVVASLALIPLLGLRQSVPLTELRPVSVYSDIAREPEDYYVLDYPYGLTNTFDTGPVPIRDDNGYLSVYAVWHHKRTLSGSGPYYSPEYIAWTDTLPFLHPDSISADRLDEAADELAGAVNQWRIGYIFVHTDHLTLKALEATTRLIEASRSVCPPVNIDGGRVKLYRARWHPFGCQFNGITQAAFRSAQ